MRVLVTGGAGFIGWHVTRLLLESGNQVLSIDCMRDYYTVDLKNHRIKELRKDWSNKEFIFHQRDLFEDLTWASIRHFDPEAVVHLAAQPGVRQGIAGSANYVRDNISVFLKVLAYIDKNPDVPLLYASSSSVYGRGSSTPFSETSKEIKPSSIYGVTKLANELLVNCVLDEERTKSRGLRFFTAYGSAGRPDMAYFRLIASALFGTPFVKFGSGKILRDFTYIDDISYSLVKLVSDMSKDSGAVCDVVNIGGGEPHSLNELIFQVEEITGKKIEIVQREGFREDLETTHSDFSYLSSLIGKTTFTKLAEGLELTIRWFQEIPKERILAWIGNAEK